MGNIFYPSNKNIKFQPSIRKASETNTKNGFVKSKIETTEKCDECEIDTGIETLEIEKYRFRISDIVKEVFKSIKYKERNDEYISRTAKKRHLEEDRNDDSRDESDCKYIRKGYPILFTDVYPFEDLEKYLSECSLDSSNSSEEVEDLKKSASEVVKERKIEIQKVALKSLLIEQKKHLDFAIDKKKFFDLKSNLNMASRNKMIHEIIDLTNDDGNPAISLAIMNSNCLAFCYLLTRNPKIPEYIYENKSKIPFLNYVAIKGKMKTAGKVRYLLKDVLNIVIEGYDEKTIEKYLCEVSEDTKLSLPHLLLTIYQKSPDIRQELTKCLQICLEKCPYSFSILCNSYFCLNYKFDVICHAIILPVTNFEIIEYFMNSSQSFMDKEVYKSLVKVHEDPITKQKLIKLLE